MSFKNLFDKAEARTTLANQSAQEVGSAIESEAFQTQDIIKEERFIPAVDYSSASSFARYGSAEMYYRDSIDRIIQQYPYDGSLRERLQWENDSTEIDLYLYDNLYPRSTGYILLSADGWGAQTSAADGYGLPTSPEYIYLKGGPHANPNGMEKLYLQFTGSNYYDTGSNRGSNLKYDLSGSGVTVEFWMKKDAWTGNTTKEVVLDVWNGNTIGNGDYGRLRVALDSAADGGAPFLVTLKSGSKGVIDQSVGSSVTVADEAWHHYALTFMSSETGIDTRLYVDGNLNQKTKLGSDALNQVTGALQGNIGALVTTTAGGGAQYAGKLSASLDEFRYWKTKRTGRDVGRFWFTQVGGGTNDDPMPFEDTTVTANTDLGVYYKFNEGITGVTATDSNILDYSGRVTNGAWTGYSSSSRNTGSAIISSSAAIKEFQDPIIYPFHPEVASLRTSLIQSGSEHDADNTAMMYSTIPSWITEDDFESGEHVRKLTQILSSYFDTLHLQAESLNKLKDIDYVSGSNKPTVYGHRLLSSHGLVTPDLFVDASVLEKLGDRSEDRVFEKSLSELKNLIYQNIYNNLSYIYKSKGTEKAFRNLIRAFGVDDDLIKINMYANNVEFDFTTNRKNKAIAKKYVNFNTISNSDASVFQLRNPGDTANTTGFISSSTNLTGGYAVTLESEVYFPKKFSRSDDWYTDTNIISSSLFGVHATTTQPTDTPGSEPAQTDTTIPVDNATNFQVYAVRDSVDSPNIQFILTGSDGGYVPRLTSSLFLDVYNNNQWNVAVKIRPQRYPWVAQVSDASNAGYFVEFEGVHVEAGIILNSFNVTGTIAGGVSGLPAFMSGSRRVFLGSNKTNVTGATLQRSDTKIGSCRLWLDNLTTEEMQAHALDPQNYGRTNSGMYAFPFQSSASYGDIPACDTLLLNWNFNQNTGSNADGGFRVADLSSGSASRSGSAGWLSNLLYMQHPGSGSEFEASSTSVTDKDFVITSKQNLPEALESSDMITVLSQQDDVEFTIDSRPTNYFLAFEKSMQQAISEEMINYFASLSDLNTLIGAPVNLYRPHYKGLNFVKQQFFETVSNDEIDFEKFFEYYKWIDDALSTFLAQLAPVSLDFDPNIRTLIESHILERSKYQHKFPFLAKSEPDISGTIGTIASPITVNSIINDAQGTGIESAHAPTKRVTGMPNTSLLNSWKYDHAPLPTASWVDGARPQQDAGSLAWWQNRAVRGGDAELMVLNATGGMPSGALADRQVLLNAIKASNSRTLNRPYKFSGGGSVVLGGVAQHINKRKDFVYDATTPMGPVVGTSSVPQNIMVAVSGDVEQLINTSDVYFPSQKSRLGFGINPSINIGNTSSVQFYSDYPIVGDGATLAPFSLYSSSIDDELATEMSAFTGSTIITNMHADLASTRTDIPMQGPFTEKFVGGREHRHIRLNEFSSKNPAFNGLDTRENRPEGFRVMMGYELTGATGTTSPWKSTPGRLQVVGPQYPEIDTAAGISNLSDRPKANLSRVEYAKRPVNIKNIKMTTGSLSQSMSGTIDHNRIGNYSKNYEVIQTAGRSQNDPFFQDQSFDFALYPETLATRGRFPLENPRHGALYFADGTNSTYADGTLVGSGTFLDTIMGGAEAALKPHAVSMWIYADSSGTDDNIFFSVAENAVSTGRYFRIFNVQSDPYLYAWLGTDAVCQSTTGQFQQDAWNHIAFVTSGGVDHGGDLSTYWYINGVDATNSSTAGTPKAITADQKMWLGVYGYNMAYDFYPGYVCDFAIWEACLSPDNVQEIYNKGRRWDLESSTISNQLALWSSFGSSNLSSDWRRNPNGNSPAGFNGGKYGGGNNTWRVGGSEEYRELSGALNLMWTGGQTQVLSGNLDYAIPARTGSDSNQSIIVNRFNAPGGWDVSSQGYMDPAHEEYSVYNALPFRNRHVINYGVSGSASAPPSGSTIIVQDQIDRPRGLDQLWTLHTGRYGADAAFGEVTLAEVQQNANLTVTKPSFHKIQRNAKKRVVITGSFVAPPAATDQPLSTGSSYDNLFVQHPVPRADRNYAWITASMFPHAAFYGYDQKVLPFSGSTKVYELARAIVTGPSGSSGSSYVTASYPFGTGSDVDKSTYAPSVEPPYTTLYVSGNINFAGFAYDEYATRYVNLETHTLEPPIYMPNNHSYLMSGSGEDAFAETSLYKAGGPGAWREMGARNGTTLPSSNAAFTVAWWQKFDLTGSTGIVNQDDDPGADLDYMTPWQWTNRWGTSSRRRFWFKWYGGLAVPYFFIDGPYASLGVGDGEIRPTSAINYLRSGLWYHLAATFDGIDPDGANTEDHMKIYINGRAITTTVEEELKAPYGIDGPLWIGGSRHNCHPFVGNLDEMQVYNRDLSAPEIRDLFERAGTNFFGAPNLKDSMMSWWRFGTTPGDSVSVIQDTIRNNDAIQYYTSGVVSISDAVPASGSDGAQGNLDVSVVTPTGPGSYNASASYGLYAITGAFWSNSSITFNQTMLNLNGPYQHPSWKQIRTGEHPVARKMRETNRISVSDRPPMVAIYRAGAADPINVVRAKKPQGFTDYVESPVVSRYKPLVAAFEDLSESPVPGTRVQMKVAWGNNITYFTHNGLNSRLNLEVDPAEEQAYNGVRQFINSESENLGAYVSYGEQIYPAEANAYRQQVRSRLHYKIDNIWANNRADRTYPVTNSQGYWDNIGRAQDGGPESPWPLDTPMYITSTTSSTGYRPSYVTAFSFLNSGGGFVRSTASVFLSGGLGPDGISFYGGFSNTGMLPGNFASNMHNSVGSGTGSGGGELQNTYNFWMRKPGPTARVAGTTDSLGGWMTGTLHPAASYIRPILEVGRAVVPGEAAELGGRRFAASLQVGFHPWVAPQQSGLSPYRPYDEYAQNLRTAGKEYSIVPEFRISEHLENYFGSTRKERATNGFLSRLTNLIELTGATAAADSNARFYKTYSNSDFLELFKIVDEDFREERKPSRSRSEDDPEAPTLRSLDLQRHGTTLKASAFLSFLPYKGFYPVERTVALASYFSQSMGTFLPATRSAPGVDVDGNTTVPVRDGVSAPCSTANETLSKILLQPLFAPGILFNTIKSGIAVSNYVIRNTASDPGRDRPASLFNVAPSAAGHHRYSPLQHTAMNSYWNWTNYFANPISVPYRYGHLTPIDDYHEYNFNSSASIQSSSVCSASFFPLNLGTSASAGAFAVQAIGIVPPSGSNTTASAAIWPTNRSGFYLHKLPFEAIRRPQDYLSARGLAGRASLHRPPKWQYGVLLGTGSSDAGNNPAVGLGSGWLYDEGCASFSSSMAMSVYFNGVLANDNQNKIRWPGQMSSPLYELAIDNFLCETLNFFQDGLTSFVSAEETEFNPVKKNHYYGMRVNLYRTTDDEGNPNFGMYSRASAFGAPLKASGSRGGNITYSHLTPPYYNGGATADIIYKASYSDRPALQDIISQVVIEYNRDVETNLVAGTFGSDGPNGYLSSSYIGNVTGALHTDYVHNQMQISASVNLLDKILAVPAGPGATAKPRWLIQSKFETPVLNFYDTPSLPHGTSSMGDAGGQSGVGCINVTSSTAPFQIRGMWHQYGQIPSGSEGLFLGVQDLPTKYSSSYYSGSIELKSLRSVVGFQNAGDQRVGQLAEAKTVREAVICVPFTVKNNRRQFFSLPPTRMLHRARAFATRSRNRQIPAQRSSRFDSLRNRAAVSAQKWDQYGDAYDRQLSILTSYVLPPTLDFFTNPSVRPVYFTAFEFSDTFSQKDLQNMWQNLPPESNQKFKKLESSVHISEFWTSRFFGPENGGNVQWMVFKVKQRAAKDYDIFSKQGLTQDTPITSPSIRSPYTFNWPYDYFSLVELLKIDENMEYVSGELQDSIGAWEEMPPQPLLGASPDEPRSARGSREGEASAGEEVALLNEEASEGTSRRRRK